MVVAVYTHSCMFERLCVFVKCIAALFARENETDIYSLEEK